MIAPRISENTISSSGSMITETMSRVPPAIACAMPKETENTTSPTASSSATIGSRRSVTGPFALYCLTTINVAAGAVAEAIAPSVIATGKGSTSGPSRKCSRTRTASTISAAIRAWITPITVAVFPVSLSCASLNSFPISKAINPRATLFRVLTLSRSSIVLNPIP